MVSALELRALLVHPKQHHVALGPQKVLCLCEVLLVLEMSTALGVLHLCVGPLTVALPGHPVHGLANLLQGRATNEDTSSLRRLAQHVLLHLYGGLQFLEVRSIAAV